MREEFTHIVLTRFNTGRWLFALGKEARFRMVDRPPQTLSRLLPALDAGTTGRNLPLANIFDAASPAWFKKAIELLRPLVEPVYVDESLTDELLAEKVAATGFVSTPNLVTTRLDNDDALAIDHLANVQSAFERQEREFLVFPFGLQSFRDQLYSVFWPSNPSCR